MALPSLATLPEALDTASPSLRPAPDGFVPAPTRLLQTAQRLGTHPAYLVRDAQGWQPTSWQDYAREVRQAARALLSLGVQPGQAVAILGFNRPEWAVMAFGAMAIGALPAGIYWTSSTKDIEHVLSHSGAPVLLVDDEDRLRKALACRERVPGLRHVLMMKLSGPAPVGTLSWEGFMARGQDSSLDAELDARLDAIRPEDVGSLIYTSGTTGPSKAVVLTHGNLSWTAAALRRTVGATEQDRVLSYLPFAHIAEQLGCLHNQACSGFTVYFARTMEELGDHLKEVHPTIFFGVPRVWEKMQAAIEDKLKQASGVKAAMARWALGVGRQWHAASLEGRAPGLALTLQKRLASRLVHDKVKTALGFDQARLLISGAAPIAPDKLRFFTGLDLVVRELYGQSEACGPSTLSLPGQTRLGSVGKALPGTQIRIADDGEVLIRGPHIFQGYGGQPEATREALDGEWLRSGDLGHLDKDGYLFITGRKKDLIITSGGKNVSPGNIEAALMDTPLVEHAVACGDGRHFLTALLTLDPSALAAFAQTHGLSGNGPLHEHPEVLKALQAAVDQVNEQQARVAHIRRFAVLRQPFTIEGGELTATMKVKRKVVIDRHQAVIEGLYAAAAQERQG
ncbi:MAG TPA: AMP-dependent synthetase/ligase [Candidatus Aquabacterium excrementipullorum]|nr:AMP-dependent synthetase/ligase [Candidatus Aquabacterium excrementipullorum]